MTGVTDLIHPSTGQILFSRKELASPDNGALILATGFADELIRLRVLFGAPMSVTSCCRSAAHNKRVGGHPRSLHLVGNPVHDIDGTAAIDVQVKGGAPRVRQLIGVALQLGWSFGLYSTWIHLDRRDFVGIKPGAFGR